MTLRSLGFILLSVFLGTSACSKKETVSRYEVPKETTKAQRPQMMPGMQMPAGQNLALEEQTSQFATPKWQVPDSWQVLPSSAMRKGNFKVKDSAGNEAEITVLVFPGDVGGKLANINRWAGQIGLNPLPESYLKSLETIEIDGKNAYLVDLKHSPNSIYAAILEMPDQSWFFKIMGPSPLVESHKESFLTFLKSVKF